MIKKTFILDQPATNPMMMVNDDHEEGSLFEIKRTCVFRGDYLGQGC